MLKVYGQTHSPWVQAVLLGLHDRRINHELVTATPPALLIRSGVMMPAAKFDDAPWLLDSARILAEVGYGPVSPEERRALSAAWQGVLHRPDSSTRFFAAFSRAGDPHPNPWVRLWRNYWRSFSAFYFYVLIRFMVLTHGYNDPDDFGNQFLCWEKRLTGKAYLGGAAPDTVDLQLFGIVQCHFSIPVPPITAMLEDPRLDAFRQWLSRMQARFSDYPYLYSGPALTPALPPPQPAGTTDRVAFYAGLTTWLLLLPVTLPLVLVFRRLARR